MLIIRIHTDCSTCSLAKRQRCFGWNKVKTSGRNWRSEFSNYFSYFYTLRLRSSNGEDRSRFSFRGGLGISLPRPSCNQAQREFRKTRKESRTNPWIIEANEYSCCRGIFVTRMYEIRWTLPNNLENLNGMHISNSIPLVLIHSVRHSVVEYYFWGADVKQGARVFYGRFHRICRGDLYAGLTVRSYIYSRIFTRVPTTFVYMFLKETQLILIVV